jgi:hypothetical protein
MSKKYVHCLSVAVTRKRIYYSLESVIESVEAKAAMEEELYVGKRIKTDIAVKRNKQAALEKKKEVIVTDIAVIEADITNLEADQGFRSDADLTSLKEDLEEIEKLVSAV